MRTLTRSGGPLRTVTRGGGLLLAAGVLAALSVLSLWVGSRDIPLADTWAVLWRPDGSTTAVIVHDLRLPRTVLAVLVGAALGLAGALMQALTRNPLAEPGLLGVTMGASTAVLLAIAYLGLATVTGYVWFAFAGAAAVAVVVYLLGSAGRGVATPERLVLAGAAITAALFAFNSAVMLLDPSAFDEFRFWNVGSLAGRRGDVVAQVAPFIGAGALLALGLARPLNVLALGEDVGRALGAHLGRIRVLTAIAVTLLCGAATAAAGPIAFVGLTVPHVARMVAGPDQRWVLPYSVLFGPVLLLSADVAGRLIAAPAELAVGVVTAFVGAPVFIALCRRRKLAAL